MTLVKNLVDRAVSRVLQAAKGRDSASSYGKNHREERNVRKKQRKAEQPGYRLQENLRSRLADYVRTQGVCKKASTEELLGCTWSQWKKHMGNRTDLMETDHIFPMAKHDLQTLRGQKRCMHFSNLQPLTQAENRFKSDKLPTKAMAARVERWAWPDGVTEDMLPTIYPGWSTPLRM